MKRVLLIDADILVYTVASVEEVPTDWGDDWWTLHSDFASARLNFDSRVTRLKIDLKADHVVMALTTTERNFRKDVLPTYKLNRKTVRKPLCWKPLREYCAETYETVERPNLEGDDVLGILATKIGPISKVCTASSVEKIICSIDKDFGCIPCKYYNINKPELGIVEHSEAEADLFHMMQTLTGDTTDGYKGCDGIGQVKAGEILAPFRVPQRDKKAHRVDMWRAVVDTFKKKGFGEEYALVQARVARILRSSDYNFKERKPILWTPPAL